MKKFLAYWVVALLILLAGDLYLSFSGSKTAFAYGWDAFFILCVVIGCVMIPALLIGLVMTYPNKGQDNLSERQIPQNFSKSIKGIIVVIIVFAALFIIQKLFFLK